MTPDKLVLAMDKLHDVRALLFLCEGKAFELSEISKENGEAIVAIALSIEVSSRLLLEAVEMVDDAARLQRRGTA